MLIHLALQSAGFVGCTPAQRGSTHFSCIPIHIDEQQVETIAFEATLLSVFPIFSINDGPVESNYHFCSESTKSVGI